MSKKSYSRNSLIMSLLLSVVFSAPVQGATTFLIEGFESAFSDGAPVGWTEVFTNWLFDGWVQKAGHYDLMNPGEAHSGNYNAVLYFPNNFEDHKVWLITPPINFGETESATLEFYHLQRQGMAGGQDDLRIYYRRSETGSWTLLKSYTSEVETWTKRKISLPNLRSSYYIGFLGNAKYLSLIHI